MPVLHAVFAEGSLHLWGESAPEAKPKRARVVASYPYRTGAAELRTRLAPAGLKLPTDPKAARDQIGTTDGSAEPARRMRKGRRANSVRAQRSATTPQDEVESMAATVLSTEPRVPSCRAGRTIIMYEDPSPVDGRETWMSWFFK